MEPISDGTPLTLRTVLSLGALLVAGSAWGTAIHFQLAGVSERIAFTEHALSTRLDAIHATVRALGDDSAQRENVIYWIEQLRARNPELKIPAFPAKLRDGR